jgi:putative transposase
MRMARLKLDTAATYHAMSRIVGGQFLMGDVEKDYLRHLLRRMEVFTGCQVRTYAFLNNHFHLLLHVPVRVELTDEEVIRRARVLYGKKFAEFENTWEQWRELGQEYRVGEQLDQFRLRMYDLSEFLKTFKQRFSIFYNAHHARRGTLWEERFKSVLIEEDGHAQLVTAAYIDLNPVRAGIVPDPKEYRWSGYGEAVARAGAARRGIAQLFVSEDIDPREILPRYRQILYEKGERRTNIYSGEVTSPGFSGAAVDKVLAEGGSLSLFDALHCKVRYFSDGFIIGGKAFVERMYAEHSEYFTAKKRGRGAKKMKHASWGGLCAARELSVRVIAPPG